MSEEIRKCRACGCSGGIETRHNESRMFCKRDITCGARGPWRTSRVGAIAAWNEANTPAPQREEGVVAWMDRSIWNVKGRRDVVVGDWSAHPDHLMRVWITPAPAPEPRYAVERWGPRGAKVVDQDDSSRGCAYFDDTHPDPWGAAHAEAERLNKREQQGGE